MTELSRIRFRTLGWLALPIVAIGVAPLALRRLAHESVAWSGTWWQWVGTGLVAGSVGLGAWCVNLFNVKGRGMPLPFDPLTQFVVSGSYRFVRNPVMLGGGLILGGEALVCAPWVLRGYLLVMAILGDLKAMTSCATT